MLTFFREHLQLIALILVWVGVAVFAGPLLYVVLPLSVFLMRRNDMWPDMLFGFLIILVFSDMSLLVRPMAVVKTAKNTYIVALAVLYFMSQDRMHPPARVFYIFLPFFIYAFLPIIGSQIPVLAIEKTLSYALLFLVVPNYVLHAFRQQGWAFFRNLGFFGAAMLASQWLMHLLVPAHVLYMDGRFIGFFGNPNGMALFCSLFFMLFTVINHLRPALFSTFEKALIYGLLAYLLITCGARTSLMATLMFVLFIPVFRLSTYLGIVAFLLATAVGELVSSNLPAIIIALGLEEYMRLDTLEGGSGRYIAWNFAWEAINERGWFLFGAGWANEELLMQQNYRLLLSLGHFGGVHNSFLAFWLNTGIVGILLFLRSLVLVFIKAGKNSPVAYAVLFSILFSAMYESWLAGSLNPYTIVLLIILTILSEEEIMRTEANTGLPEELPVEPAVPPLIVPAR